MLKDRNDYPLSGARRIVRSAMFRLGLTGRLGRLFWKQTSDASYIEVVYRRESRVFGALPKKFCSNLYTEALILESSRWDVQEDLITVVTDCTIEPNRCLMIGPDGALITQSVPQRKAPLFPSVLGYAQRGKGVYLAKALVYDGFASKNFYHHLVDCVASLLFFQQQGKEDRDIPVIVARWIFDSPFFSSLLKKSELFASVNWFIQEPGQWLRVGRAYRARANHFDPVRWKQIRALYGKVSTPSGRRTFLSRDARLFSRGLRNEAEVSGMLAKYGFETVYFEHLSIEDQQRVMEESEYVVALQGMALIQQLFMSRPRAHILELMPANRLQTEYYWLGWTLGARYYDVQVHSPLGRDGKYEIDTRELELGVRRMLDSPAGEQTYGLTTLGVGDTGAQASA